MEEKKEEEGEAEEYGPEHWFSKWERQCLAEEAARDAPSEGETEQSQRKLWHLFHNSATAVAQLYKDRVCQQQQGLSLWVPFQTAATAVTNLYKESVEAHQHSYDLGIQMGYQRRNRDVLAWVKKRRRNIRREDLISFLCGKAPPPRNPRAPPKMAAGPPGRPAAEAASSVETDLQPFREAIALHGLSGAMASISVRSGAPGSPTHPRDGPAPLAPPPPPPPPTRPPRAAATASTTSTSTPSSPRRWRCTSTTPSPPATASGAPPSAVTSSRTRPRTNATGCSEPPPPPRLDD